MQKITKILLTLSPIMASGVALIACSPVQIAPKKETKDNVEKTGQQKTVDAPKNTEANNNNALPQAESPSKNQSETKVNTENSKAKETEEVGKNPTEEADDAGGETSAPDVGEAASPKAQEPSQSPQNDNEQVAQSTTREATKKSSSLEQKSQMQDEGGQVVE